MKKIVVATILVIGTLLILSYNILYNRWEHLWTLEKTKAFYSIKHHNDDTLRVLMIGDSWAGMHHEGGLDSLFVSMLQSEICRPAKFEASGKGGEKSRGIYKLMFEESQYGTRRFLLDGPDYCIISAGINDAAANMGTIQYCHHYNLILDFLLKNHICPVVIEIPDVDIWHLYSEKPFWDLAGDFLKAGMTGCRLYHYSEYREDLINMLKEKQLMERIIFVPMEGWNSRSPSINPDLFLEDRIHLNKEGYRKLDSCIIKAIVFHYNNR